MHIPKRYGEGKVEKCPFCKAASTAMNAQGIPVCKNHRTSILNEMKCICGEEMEMMKGKFGVFFNCINCGNMNMRKALEINMVKDIKGESRQGAKPNVPGKENAGDDQGEMTVRSDDPRYFD